MTRAPVGGRAAAVAACLVVVGVSLRALTQARDYALLGLDSWPLVLASRVGSPAELLRRLAQPLFAELQPAPYHHISGAVRCCRTPVRSNSGRRGLLYPA